MKVALFNCHARSIPPIKSGGIEKIMNYLINGLIEKGVDVTVFSTADSKVNIGAKLIDLGVSSLEDSDYPDDEKERLNGLYTDQLGEILIDMQDNFDLIHNHCLGSCLNTVEKLNTLNVSTLHEDLNIETIARFDKYKDLKLISVSNNQREPMPNLSFVGTVYNGIDIDEYRFCEDPEDYLVFVGRISQQKAPHKAIQIAKILGKKLIILGKYKDTHIEENYYKNTFLPLLNENKSLVEWRGELSTEELIQIISKAKASIHTPLFREPFGISIIEAMATGTPVLSLRRGSAEEIIKEGINGFLGEDIEELVDKFKKIENIDRRFCRQYVKDNFSSQKMINDYFDIYQRLILNQTE